MRAGGCTLQQALTPEATTVVKQAVGLARRRGHAQVTPLHVASTMLSSSTGLLRAACLQSHSHPLQCKALELCFNVALNRLPASTSSGPMLGHHHSHHHHPPSLSNALVAAFKRAQAHQRRGSVESQQQPLLAVKIEIEQLVISILDDPSVSRVMREAGFSSTQVKSNVEKSVSLEMCTPSPCKPKQGNINQQTPLLATAAPQQANSTTAGRPSDPSRSYHEDVMSVVSSLMDKKKRSVVIVGECLASAEEVVKGLMDKVDRGELVPEVFRNAQFISLPLFSFSHLSREEVEQKVGELRCQLVKSCCAGRGVVLYVGDLKWAAEYWASCGEKGSRNYYCPVEHIIMELGRLVCGGIGEGSLGGRFWFMGIATYATYMRCRAAGHPSLEALWGLHPVAIPAGSLGLSLSHDSYLTNPMRSKKSGDESYWSLKDDGLPDNQLGCRAYCFAKSDDATQTQLPTSTASSKHDSNLPSWLQQYKEDGKKANSNDLDCLHSIDHCKRRWSIIWNSAHKDHHDLCHDKTPFFSPTSSSLASLSSGEQHYSSSLSRIHGGSWPLPLDVKHPWKEQLFVDDHDPAVSSSRENKEPPLAVLLAVKKPNPIPAMSTTSTADTILAIDHRHNSFKEINAENLKILCNVLEKKVPWQMEIVPEIASTVLRCRSGMVRRRERSTSTKEDTWLFFLGCDVDGKEKISRELAALVFDSHTSFVSIGLSNFSPTKSADSSVDDLTNNKRSRSEGGRSYFERFVEAVRNKARGVFLLEDMEQVDRHSQVAIRRAIESGRLMSSSDGGEEVPLEDAIVILSCESFDCRSRACSPPVKQRVDSDEEEGKDVNCDKEDSSSCFSLDLNISIGDDDQFDHGQPFDDVGLVDYVDRSFYFRMRDDIM